MAQMQVYIKRCEISNVVFNKVFWTYCNNDVIDSKDEEITQLKNSLGIQREPRKNRLHPINFIIYGAPGTAFSFLC